MTDSADSPSTPQPASHAGASAIMLVSWLVIGLALRWAHVQGLGDTVFEWEADGFLLGWEGWTWGAWNRMRPPGFGAAMATLVRTLGVETVTGVRLACVGLSLVGLLAALELARTVSRRTGLGRRSLWRAAAWGACVWALHPALIRASVSPTPALVLAPVLCLLAARLVSGGDGLLPWLGAAIAAAGAAIVGGVIVVIALALGVLVYLLPVPRLGRSLRALTLVGLAAAALYLAQRGPDSERVWVPDMAPAYSALALMDEGPPHPNDVPTQSDRAALQRLDLLRRSAGRVEPAFLAAAFGRRLRDDLLGPGRLEPLVSGIEPAPPPSTLSVLGWLDVFIRGGLLLFACAVLGLLKSSEPRSSLPRAGAVIGALAFLVLTTIGALGPLGLVPVDLLMLGLAAGGVAGTSANRGWTRRVAFGVGGVLLCTFLYTAGARPVPLSSWIGAVDQHANPGAMLVGMLDTPDPGDLDRELRITGLLMQAGTPLLRLPEAAMTHALQATRLAPTADTTLQMMVRAQVENAQYRDAARLAEAGLALHPVGSFDHRSMELLLEWVRQEERMGMGLTPARPH